MNSNIVIELPQYENPPLIEVVVGAQFESIKSYQAPYLWKLWESLGKDDFPTIEAVENLSQLDLSPRVYFSTEPEMPRHWFIHKDDTSLVQFQRDRFLFNWRKGKNDSATYPRYPDVIQNFYKYFDALKTSLECSEISIKLPDIEMLELTYINIIPLSDLNNELGNIGTLLKDTSWEEKTFLTSPKAVNLQWWFEINEINSKMKVHVTSAQKKDDGVPILRMEISVMGAAPSTQIDDCRTWYDEARKYIVQSFDDLTASGMQKKWGKV